MIFRLFIVALVVLFAGIVITSKQETSDSAQSSRQVLEFDNMIGKTAPDFSLPSYDGKTYTLSELQGKNVVLFFNEGLMCYPACWNQIAALGTDERFNNKDTVALNVVPDSRDGWSEAIQRMPELGKGTLLLDADKSVSAQYGTMDLPSSMHRGGMPGHTFVLIDKSGVVRYTYDDVKMGVRNDMLAEELDKLSTDSQ